MKQKHLFVGILCIGLVFMMVLAGCEYNGPSVNEIANAVEGKLNDPSADEIADTALERSELNQYSGQIKYNLVNSGKLTITKDILAWGQTDTAYTLAVNTAEHQSINLFNDPSLVWDGDGSADIKRYGSYIEIAEKSTGGSATFNFTITDSVDTTKIIKGTLTITTSYDNSTVGVAVLNEFFEKLYSYNLNDETTTFTTVKPIANWGQTDAAYTITADLYDGNSFAVYSPNSAPVLYENYYGWEDASVDWKPPVLGDLTYNIYNSSPSGSINIDGRYIYFSNYSGTAYYLSTNSTTVKTATFNFRITRGDQSISGTVTVNLKKATKTPEQIQQETEKELLEDLRSNFNSYFRPSSNISYYGGVVSRYIDKDITAFGQEDVLYTISARGGNNYSDYNPDTGEEIYYGYVSLPSVYDGTITWTTKTSNAAVVLQGSSYLKVYTGKTGTAEFNFTYTYTYPGSTAKTIKGSIKVTVIP